MLCLGQSDPRRGGDGPNRTEVRAANFHCALQKLQFVTSEKVHLEFVASSADAFARIRSFIEDGGAELLLTGHVGVAGSWWLARPPDGGPKPEECFTWMELIDAVPRLAEVTIWVLGCQMTNADVAFLDIRESARRIGFESAIPRIRCFGLEVAQLLPGSVT